MKINLKRVKDCKVQMTVEVDADRAEDRYREVIQNFQRAARLPGFREGKAPADLVEQRFASEAREEMLKSLIPEVYHQTVQAQKVSPVSLPRISDIRYERGKKLTFNAEFEESPNVSVKNYKGITLKRESAELKPDELEKGVQSLLESRATFEPVLEGRAVRAGDFVVADLEIWKDGAYAPGRKGVLLFVEPGGEDDFFDKVLGANVDDVREVTRKGQPYTRLRVRGLRQKRVPVLDDEFAKNLGRQNADEVRESVRKELASYRQADSMERMKQELFSKLLKLSSFALPESLVVQQKERVLEQARRRHFQMGATEELWKAELPGLEAESAEKAKDQVKLYFILRKIGQNEKIDVDETEFTQRLQALSEQAGRPLEEARRVFEEDLRESLKEKRTIDFLIANAKFDET